jgi:predicted Rossmann-fold nucleotide-binding protein
MLDESDVFIALPGGVGTLDEVFTVAASYTIGYHHKRVILYNMLGFWDATIAMLDDLQQRGMVRGQWCDYICVANSLQEIESFI